MLGMNTVIDFEYQERIGAPVRLVWEELEFLDRVLAQMPEALGFEVEPDGRTASLTIKLGWGPMKWTAEGQASLREAHPVECFLLIEVPRLQLRYEGTMHLVGMGREEAKLTYSGHLECRHWLVGRMRGLLGDLLEQHVSGVVARVNGRAERRHLAEQRLLRSAAQPARGRRLPARSSYGSRIARSVRQARLAS